MIKTWYNGYNWLGREVYNPFDILLYLDSREFSNFWFETATPTFLIRLMQEKQYYIPKLHDLRPARNFLAALTWTGWKSKRFYFKQVI